MKKYVVSRLSPVDEKIQYIVAPNMEAIKRWITEVNKASINSLYQMNNGVWIARSGDTEFTIRKWKEPDWITL